MKRAPCEYCGQTPIRKCKPGEFGYPNGWKGHAENCPMNPVPVSAEFVRNAHVALNMKAEAIRKRADEISVGKRVDWGGLLD